MSRNLVVVTEHRETRLTLAAKPEEPSQGYYVLVVDGDVEPYLHGPYKTEQERDTIAKRIRSQSRASPASGSGQDDPPLQGVIGVAAAIAFFISATGTALLAAYVYYGN